MYRGAALIAALLAVSGCAIDPVDPMETRVDYAGYVTTADQAAGYANVQCAEINRLAAFKAEDVIDGRKGATFQCLPVPKCFPAEALAAPARSGIYMVPPAATARLPGRIVAMAPIVSSGDEPGGTYIPYAAIPVAAGPQPQPIPSFEAIAVPPGPDPVSVAPETAGPQPVGSFATGAPATWQRAVTCKPYDTLPLLVDRNFDLF